jgi:multidrug efflux pump subunit AcrA (membrane-fusion protein)
MHFDGISDVNYQGHISRTPLKSQPSPQFTIPYFDVSVSFDTFDKRLKIGMTCDLNVIVEHKDQALLVDASAIYFKDSPGVFVRTPEGFAFRPVQLGIEGTTKVEVLSGLKQGEAIILNALEVAKNIDQ